ncbi:MAG: hypothetical protein NTY77_15595 [Elusimicrobia bacterium]|nr:hypothetical protein [Elusimicrobiota bacterium]
MKTLCLMGTLALLSGCVPSLHPLYTDKDIISDPALQGEWSTGEKKDSWKFVKENDKLFTATYTDEKGKPGRFEAHLLKIKDRMFLDLFPSDPELKENEYFKWHLFPVHTFIRVYQIEPTLKMAMFNPSWFVDFLAKSPQSLKHEIVGDRIVLTAQPKELQAFLIKHEDSKEIHFEPIELRRRAN